MAESNRRRLRGWAAHRSATIRTQCGVGALAAFTGGSGFYQDNIMSHFIPLAYQ